MDDSKLVSCGTDGAVYEWNLSSGKRETECVIKSCSYNCVTISPDAKIIFAVGSDQTLKEIADSSVSPPLGLSLGHCSDLQRSASQVYRRDGERAVRTGSLLPRMKPGSSFLSGQLSHCYFWSLLPSA